MDAYIVAYRRSPFEFARKGRLAGVRPDDLMAQVVRAMIECTGVPPDAIEEFVLGASDPEGEQGANVARLVTFLAGLPVSVAAFTLTRFCGSSMTAIHHAAGAIAAGAGDAILCGGVESMSRVPRGGANPSPNPALRVKYPQAYVSMGVTAENVARRYGLSRVEQEQFALSSQSKAAQARDRGGFEEEIVAITLPDGNLVDSDGCLRPGTTLEGLAKLAPAFEPDGTVTAGTSSPLTDGASAVLVARERWIVRHGLKPLARIRSIAAAGCEPELMGIGPVPATRKALHRAGISASDLDVIELNEAFASQAIACIRDLDLDESRINVDGGAIALGHPLGATGARITGKAAQLLAASSGGRYALSTQCVGGGQGVATVLERC